MSRLTEAASAGSFDSLSDVWLEELESGIPVEEMLLVVRALSGADRVPLARELVELAIEAMDDGVNTDLPVLLRGTADLFGVFEGFRRSLVESLRDEHLMFQPLELFLRTSGLSTEGAVVSEAWETFTSLMKYSEGGHVYHPMFGPGKVLRISRTFISIDFRKAPDHEMNLDVALDTTTPLGPDSLVLLASVDPEEFRDLLGSRPEEFLARMFREPFGSPGEVARGDLAPLLAATEMSQGDLWKVLRRAASKSPGVSDIGDRIIMRREELSPAGQIDLILEDRRMPASEMTREIHAVLGSAKRLDPETRGQLAEKALKLKRPETGALYELVWTLSGGSRKALPGEAERFVESTAARAGRALDEIHSLSCRKLYLEAFLSSGTDGREKLLLLSRLKRSMWEHSARYLENVEPGILHENIGLFLSDPSRTDRFLWALTYCAESDSPLDVASDMEQIDLFLGNIIFAKAETQKRVIGLLLGKMKEHLDSHLSSRDARSLQNLLDSLDDSTTAHREGLYLAVNRELARRKESAPAERTIRRFWETDLLFSSRSSIADRQEAILKLRQVEIPAAADAIGEAASHGDLSENAEYTAAIERRDLLLDRLNRWDEEMKRYSPYPASEVSEAVTSPGTRVRLRAGDGEDAAERSLDLVGPLDADPERGRINYLAPLGSLLLGRSKGDSLVLPEDEDVSWEIVAVEVLEEVGRS